MTYLSIICLSSFSCAGRVRDRLVYFDIECKTATDKKLAGDSKEDYAMVDSDSV